MLTAGFVCVIFVGGLAVVNLVLTFGVIRRLRNHDALIRKYVGKGGGSPLLPAGEHAADFRALAIDGSSFTRDDIVGPTLFGFFMVDCGSCVDVAPQFQEYAEMMPGGLAQATVVVAGKRDEALKFANHFNGIRVIVEEVGGQVARAFGVSSFPSVGLVDVGGLVVNSANEPSQLKSLAELR